MKDLDQCQELDKQVSIIELKQEADIEQPNNLNKYIAENGDESSRIRGSRFWRSIRNIKPVKRGLKQIARTVGRTRRHKGSKTEASLSNSKNVSNREDFLETLPEIAACFRDYGMRPGNWVAPEITKAFQKQGFTVVANTFYAITPDLNELSADEWRPRKYAEALKTFKVIENKEFFQKISEFSKDLDSVPLNLADKQGHFYWSNPMFSPLDAIAYYGIIRSIEPKRILEVGSGYSTALALMAADKASRQIEISCIEPYPSSFLLKNEKKLASLIQRKVQDIDPVFFESLEEGDILFIDSSHCSRLGSDVNFLLFEVIPRLRPGVYVHFHDIFLPSEYPRQWLEDIGIMWNEQYLILAFLMFNKDFEIIWSSSISGLEKREEIEKIFLELLPEDAPFLKNLGSHSGGSLWLRKV